MTDDSGMFDAIAVQRALDVVNRAIQEQWSEGDRDQAVQAFLDVYRKAIGGTPARVEAARDWDLFAPLDTYHKTLKAMNDARGAATVMFVLGTLIARRDRHAQSN